MSASQSAQAARNNAVWCDTVCRAHGVPGEFADGLWLQRRPGPPHYPNLVTLDEGAEASAVTAALAELAAVLPGDGWGVKDSFAVLDLHTLGFAPLFDAQWLWSAPRQPLQGVAAELQWAPLSTAAELRRWEAAWAGDGAPMAAALFPPALLAEPGVHVLAGMRGGRVVAGGIVNRSSSEVGLSNVFAPAALQASAYAAVGAAAQVLYPGLPLVGYESGEWLQAAQHGGFEPVGPLRVWLRRAGPPGPRLT